MEYRKPFGVMEGHSSHHRSFNSLPEIMGSATSYLVPNSRSPMELQKVHYLKTRSKMAYDRRHGVKELEPLAPREQVWISDLKRQDAIQGTAKYPRSYYLSSEAATLRRNRRQIVKVPEEESRKQVPVKATNIQGAAATARLVASGKARSMMARPFDQDTPPRYP
ncbi:hypothetical protein PR048_022194 [Dryococelus australis]|uniref:Uncharacterized protein n=1 Tax=Dryococelus australis TaxID=614101 RepID=A0ABQ9H0B0_9NEOP|nr:hypothetical protein PR048_022194 [Dryococelus australis]